MKNLLWIVPLLSLLTACSNAKSKDVLEEEAKSVVAESAPIQVEVAVSSVRPLGTGMHYTRGKLRSPHEVALSFQIGGYIEDILGKNGQQVKKGKLLARLDNRQQKISLAERQVAHEQAYSLYENKLAGYGDTTQYGTTWKRIKEKLALSEGLEAAKVALERARFELDQTQLTAPITGIIEGLELFRGSQIASGQSLFTIHRNDYLLAEAQVMEFNVPQLKIGDRADIVPVSQPDKTYQASIAEINPRVDNQGQTLVKLRLTEVSGLLPGMNVDVKFHSQDKDRLLVPKQAVVNRPDGRRVVFVYDNGQAKWKYVQVGEEDETHIAITEGIAPGDSIITTNVFQLAHDSPVVIEDAGD